MPPNLKMLKDKMRDKIMGTENQVDPGEILLPTYQNFYQDVNEFLGLIRREIGPNITIAMISEDGNLTLSFHFHRIPALAELDIYQAVLDEADLKEPDVNTTTVIVDAVKGWIAQHEREVRAHIGKEKLGDA